MNILRDTRGSGDVELLAILIGIAMLGAIDYGVVMATYDLCCRPAPTAFEKWVEIQHHRCSSMRSRLTVGVKENTVECYRTPFMRRPKLEFRETYQGEVK